eukprot:TRINITY_DN2951_c0_g1_i2.p1 TRINITY_DN2951_c0_g1~~TRINITY_DN2951_c0_g1_i2.p1  ORF type:complete len:866 (-),score=184.98 TRINITY_DN2951_c0_g1_i2:1961-4558(-)
MERPSVRSFSNFVQSLKDQVRQKFTEFTASSQLQEEMLLDLLSSVENELRLYKDQVDAEKSRAEKRTHECDQLLAELRTRESALNRESESLRMQQARFQQESERITLELSSKEKAVDTEKETLRRRMQEFQEEITRSRTQLGEQEAELKGEKGRLWARIEEFQERSRTVENEWAERHKQEKAKHTAIERSLKRYHDGVKQLEGKLSKKNEILTHREAELNRRTDRLRPQEDLERERLELRRKSDELHERATELDRQAAQQEIAVREKLAKDELVLNQRFRAKEEELEKRENDVIRSFEEVHKKEVQLLQIERQFDELRTMSVPSPGQAPLRVSHFGRAGAAVSPSSAANHGTSDNTPAKLRSVTSSVPPGFAAGQSAAVRTASAATPASYASAGGFRSADAAAASSGATAPSSSAPVSRAAGSASGPSHRLDTPASPIDLAGGSVSTRLRPFGYAASGPPPRADPLPPLPPEPSESYLGETFLNDENERLARELDRTDQQLRRLQLNFRPDLSAARGKQPTSSDSAARPSVRPHASSPVSVLASDAATPRPVATESARASSFAARAASPVQSTLSTLDRPKAVANETALSSASRAALPPESESFMEFRRGIQSDPVFVASASTYGLSPNSSERKHSQRDQQRNGVAHGFGESIEFDNQPRYPSRTQLGSTGVIGDRSRAGMLQQPTGPATDRMPAPVTAPAEAPVAVLPPVAFPRSSMPPASARMVELGSPGDPHLDDLTFDESELGALQQKLDYDMVQQDDDEASALELAGQTDFYSHSIASSQPVQHQLQRPAAANGPTQKHLPIEHFQRKRDEIREQVQQMESIWASFADKGSADAQRVRTDIEELQRTLQQLTQSIGDMRA